MSESKKCSGVVVPMVTCFTVDGNIDGDSARKSTRYLISQGCIPFILGTTGEAVSIPSRYKKEYAEAVVEEAARKESVYAGISSNCLEESVNLANDFASVGVDYVVSHLPFYYPLKPPQMKQYFLHLADSIDLPLILYNITSTTHMSIPVELIIELSQHSNIVGIKDSERNPERQKRLIDYCRSQDDFSHFTGWGAQCADALSVGSDGIVPSTGNLVPLLYRRLFEAAVTGKPEITENLQRTVDSVSAIYQKGRSLGESIAGLKLILSKLGLCKKYVLPPLSLLPSDDEKKILSDMQTMNVSQLSGLKEIKA